MTCADVSAPLLFLSIMVGTVLACLAIRFENWRERRRTWKPERSTTPDALRELCQGPGDGDGAAAPVRFDAEDGWQT